MSKAISVRLPDSLAEKLGRAPETVRLALLRHDRESPAERIFERRSRRKQRDIAPRLWAAS